MKFKFFFYLSVLSIFVFASCKDKFEPAGPIMGQTNLIIPAYYLTNDFCNEFHEGSEKSLEIEVTVDGIDADLNPIFMGIDVFNATNNDDSDFMETIDVPEEGTFVITVTIRGQDCYSCCNGHSCSAGDNGKIRYRGNSVSFNAVPPPVSVTITPEFVICTNCGC